MIALNAICMLGHVLLGVYILKRYSKYTVFFGYVFFVQTWSLVSCFYNDLGIYNFELFRYTHTTLATSRLALFLVVFNLGFLMIARLLRDREPARHDYHVSTNMLRLGTLKIAGIVLLGSFFVYVVYTFATEGIPILQGMHRLLFLEETDPLERWFVGHSFLIAFILGYYRRKRRWISFSGLVMLLMVVYLLAIGNKFSAFVRVLVPYLAALFIEKYKSNPRFTIFNKRYVLAALGVVVILLSISYASYVFWGQGEESGAARLLSDRVLALQGHLWWAADYERFGLDHFDADHWEAELSAVLHPESVSEGSVGMKYVMVRTIGADRAFPIFDIGYLYTMAYPAILIMTFPVPVALIFQLLAGMIFAGLLYYLHFKLLYRHAIRAMASVWIVIPFIDVICNGNLHWLFAPVNGVLLRPVYLLAAMLFLRLVSGTEGAGSVIDRTSEPGTAVMAGQYVRE